MYLLKLFPTLLHGRHSFFLHKGQTKALTVDAVKYKCAFCFILHYIYNNNIMYLNKFYISIFINN